MEQMEFDAALGGAEKLPHSANSLKFTASRSIEIAAMTESILRSSKTKLIFQTLPVHMRRRVMSHNCKRLPRRLREGHLEQLKKSGLPPKQKRPSRKYRRRATNLLEEYNRRQRKNVWLETHIWHAKRFHMIERWNHRLAYRPCDKAFRACYRASSAHCLMQDISYYTPIQIKGSVETIKEMFSCITNSCCGLSIGAKAYLNGNRRGTIHLYMPDSYPFEYIGHVEFLWVSPNVTNKELWLFVHPSFAKQLSTILSDIMCKSKSNCNLNNDSPVAKKRKISTKYSDIQIKVMTGMLNRFRLTGPKSHAVLVRTLKCVKDMSSKTNDWFKYFSSTSRELCLQEKYDYWENVSSVRSPSQLPPGIIIGLIVKDPRLSRPNKRTKAQNECTTSTTTESLVNIPPYLALSPIWDTTVCEKVQENKITNAQYIDHLTKTQLVPGEVHEDDPFLQHLPIVLIQRPGSQNSDLKKIGYGSGWDIIIPSGYGLPFWLTFIMFGGRSGGLRETESLALEMGNCYMPPDSEAGKAEEKRTELELKEKYFRRPPSKRVNYIKLAVPSPFICPWNVLLKDWGNAREEKFYVLRDRHVLHSLQECIDLKRKPTKMERLDSCLIPVYIQIIGKGNLTKHAMICVPNINDDSLLEKLMEPLHEDSNAILRKQKRKEHKQLINKMRRKRMKLKKNKTTIKEKLKQKKIKEPSEYVKVMRELWLPSNVESVRKVASREVMGYLLQAAFSFSESKSCGVGYVAYNALTKLLDCGMDRVLVRNTTSRTYRLANIRIINTL